MLSKDGCILGFFLMKQCEIQMENGFISVTKNKKTIDISIVFKARHLKRNTLRMMKIFQTGNLGTQAVGSEIALRFLGSLFFISYARQVVNGSPEAQALDQKQIPHDKQNQDGEIELWTQFFLCLGLGFPVRSSIILFLISIYFFFLFFQIVPAECWR